MEKRSFSRIEHILEVLLKARCKLIKGHLLNLSLDGAFLMTPESLSIGEAVEMTLSISAVASNMEVINVVLGGKVIRVDEDGTAVQFDRLDLDSLTHLKNIIEKNLIDQYLKSIAIE